ncbi:MAG: LysR family transcriptional regulator [Clostridia bacterium]|nr:LysR family transcriptional regulator [Clostridia bacterium]
MNTNQLRYFVSVAETRSFTRAAAAHYITQTAITQQIRALEDMLQVTLFDRRSRPVALTLAGSAFLVEAKAILSRIDRAVERVQEASVGWSGTLRIGYTKGYERSDLSGRLGAFHAEFPNVLLSCYRRNTDQLAAGLLRGEYDMIFTWDSSELCKNDEVSWRVAERSPLTLAVYNSHPLARRRQVKRSELKGEPILFMTLSSNGESVGDSRFVELYEHAGYHPDILFRSGDAESILMMVAAEQGVSILPSFVTGKLVNADNLTFVPMEGAEEKVEIIAAWRRNDENPLLARFLESLK